MPDYQETCIPTTFTDNEWLAYRRAHQPLFDQVAAMEALQRLIRLESYSIVSSCLGCNYPAQNQAPLLHCSIRLKQYLLAAAPRILELTSRFDQILHLECGRSQQ